MTSVTTFAITYSLQFKGTVSQYDVIRLTKHFRALFLHIVGLTFLRIHKYFVNVGFDSEVCMLMNTNHS